MLQARSSKISAPTTLWFAAILLTGCAIVEDRPLLSADGSADAGTSSDASSDSLPEDHASDAPDFAESAIVDSSPDAPRDADASPDQETHFEAGTDADATPPEPGDAGTDSAADASDGSDASGIFCAAGRTLCGTNCYDLSGDSLHCGACDHDCLGAPCNSGLCAPTSLGKSQGPNDYINDLALTSDAIYWSGSTTIYSTSIVQPAPSPDIAYDKGAFGPQFVRARNGFLYWSDTADQKFYSLPLSNLLAAPTPLVSFSNAGDMLVESDAIYWTEVNAGEVRRFRFTDSVSTPIANGLLDPFKLAILGNMLYWTAGSNPGAIMRAPADAEAGAAETFVPDQDRLSALAVTSDALYWAAAGTIFRLDLAPSVGSPVRIALDSAGVEQIAVDSVHLYWTSPSMAGLVWRVPLTGGEPVRMAAATIGVGVGNTTAPAVSLGLDDKYVYWATELAISRVAK